MKLFWFSLILLILNSNLFAEKSQYLVGASYGQFRSDSTLDTSDLSAAYEGKIGIKEGQGIFALSYDYIEEKKSQNPNVSEQYQSVLIHLEGLTQPKKFIGSLDAQLLLGVHGGMLLAKVNDTEKQDFQYGLQGGMYFPMGDLFAMELIYRYSLTNIGFDEVKIDNIQQLNLGASFTF